MANPNQDARNHANGRYVRTPEMAARDAEAARLQGEGWTYREIAEELDYCDKAAAHRAVQRAYRAIAQPAKRVLERRHQELDLLWEATMEILENNHVVVSNGKVIALNGEPLSDDGPRLQAITELRRLNESRRKLDGSDAPTRVSVDAEHLGQEIGELLNTLTQSSDDASADTES